MRVYTFFSRYYEETLELLLYELLLSDRCGVRFERKVGGRVSGEVGGYASEVTRLSWVIHKHASFRV